LYKNFIALTNPPQSQVMKPERNVGNAGGCEIGSSASRPKPFPLDLRFSKM